MLSPVARMYLALPASSADLERSFSSAGFILEGRQRLLVRNLETQAVVRDYLVELERSHSKEVYLQRTEAIVLALQADADNTEAAAPVSLLNCVIPRYAK